MALGDFSVNLSELIPILPADVFDRVLGLVLILKTLGIVAIVYLVYLIINGILNYRRMKKIDGIYRKTGEISEKLDKLLKKRKR